MAKPIRLLIDGDVIIYQHLLGLETEIEWEPDVWSLYSDVSLAKKSMEQWIEKILRDFGVSRYTFCLSCSTQEGFRYKLNPNYKSNRKGKRKPLGFKAIREWVTEEFGAIQKPELEADDVIGILTTCPARNKNERQIVVSIDKDFRTVPCEFYRFSEKEPDVEVITPESAEHYHAIQTLTGDTVDGFSGVPGVGPKTAEKLLDGLTGKAMWDKVQETYDKKKLTKEEALLNARMAFILQSTHYKKGKIELWDFPS